MSPIVCVSASAGVGKNYGGLVWMYLNWALGFADVGCQILWMEADAWRDKTQYTLNEYAKLVRGTLLDVGLDAEVVIVSEDGKPLPADGGANHISLADAASGADLYVNLAYISAEGIVGQFRRSAFVDSDPGVMQTWIHQGQIQLADHDQFFTISENVSRGRAPVPDSGIEWGFLPPPIHLDSWPVVNSSNDAPYTVVSGWWGEWVTIDGTTFNNDKRSAYLNFVDLPEIAAANLELSLALGTSDPDVRERRFLEQRGWTVRSLLADPKPWTAQRHRSYVQASRGEFSCAKPMFIQLETGVIHDHNLQYLASGKPVIAQDTGPTDLARTEGGLLRFRTLDEARRMLNEVQTAYEYHSEQARALAQSAFDARRVAEQLLSRSL